MPLPDRGSLRAQCPALSMPLVFLAIADEAQVPAVVAPDRRPENASPLRRSEPLAIRHHRLLHSAIQLRA